MTTEAETERAIPEEMIAPREQLAPHIRGVKAHLLWLWGYWDGSRWLLAILGALTLISTAVAVAYPLVLRDVIDRLKEGLAQGGVGYSITAAMIALGLLVLGRILAGLYPGTRALMNLRLDRFVREDVFAALMKKDYKFNNVFRTGDVVTRLTDDIYEFPKISWFGCSGVFRAVESTSKLIFCLGVMMSLSWKLTLLSIVPLPIMMWFFYSLRHKIRIYVEGSQRTISKTNDLLESAFTGIQIVKAFRAEEGQKRRLAELMRERVEVFLGLRKLHTILFSLDTLASRVGQMIVIAVGGWMILRGEMTLGTLFAFYVYLDMLTHPMMDLPHMLMTAQQAFVSIDRVEQIRAYPVTIARHGGGRLEEIREIAFDSVAFAYNPDRPTIAKTSFAVPAGTRVAVVGPVASGKSTLLKLIAGILDPDRGSVLINGRRLDAWNFDDFKTLIGYVPQDSALFSKSIRENVLFGRPEPEGEEDWAATCLSIAQMDGDLPDLPAGIETVVGQKGSLVSGGQKQRIAIARALAGRPQLLLFDDCTAALDARNEEQFWAELDERLGNTTCFIVSHRLATIQRADRILVLDGGQLVDQGTHEELALRCDTYREFLTMERRKAHLKVEDTLNPEPVS